MNSDASLIISEQRSVCWSCKHGCRQLNSHLPFPSRLLTPDLLFNRLTVTMSTIQTCRLCGWSNNLDFDNPCMEHLDEVAHIWEAVEHIDEAVERLVRKRTALLQHLNASQASTRVFPQEILSTIFEHTCPPVDLGGRPFNTESVNRPEGSARTGGDIIPFSPIILGAVSSHWREVAWSTPQLWTSMSRDITMWNARSTANFLKLYLQNVSNMPFSLDLDFRNKRAPAVTPRRRLGSRWLMDWGSWSRPSDQPDYVTNPLPLEPLRDMIFVENPAKIIELRLNNPPTEWLTYFSSNLSKLETLFIGWSTKSDAESTADHFPFGSVPGLRKVTIYNTAAIITRPCLPLNPLTVTSLEIRKIQYPDAIHALLHFPNLSCLKLEDVFLPQTLRSSSSQPSILPFTRQAHLKTLDWAFPKHAPTQRLADCVRQFCQSIRLPSIQNLSLFNLSAEAIIDSGFHTFLSQLPSTLTSLSLSLPNIHFINAVHPFIACLPFMPQSISHLRIKECCPSLASSFFDSISDPSYDATLPVLTWIEFIDMNARHPRNCTQGCQLNPVPFLEFLRYKKSQGCVQLRATIDCNTCRPDRWDPEVQEEITLFMDEGFDLEFRMNPESNSNGLFIRYVLILSGAVTD